MLWLLQDSHRAYRGEVVGLRPIRGRGGGAGCVESKGMSLGLP